MGLLDNIFRRSEKRSLTNFDEYLDYLVAGQSTHSGANVTEKTALTNTAVYTCVRVLAETLASLPLPVYERLEPRGKTRANAHPLYSILHDAPNPYMTSFTFRETMMGHLLTWGNAYAEIQWTSRGQVGALWPLRPDKMRDIKTENKKVVYTYRLPDGTDRKMVSDNVFHIPGMGFDGYRGYSPVAQARQSIGLSMAVDEYGSRFFSNGARPGGVLEHSGVVTKEAKEALKKAWNSMHSGLSNSHRVAILEQGLTYKQIGVPPEDAQFLETKGYQLADIARFYRVPGVLVGLDDKTSTYASAEQFFTAFVVHTMRPWFVRWEQAIKQKLFLPQERSKYFAEFLIDGLMRGDSTSRAEYYSKMFAVGGFSVNDILEKENMNPIGAEGDQRFVPMNMIPIDKAMNEPEPQARTLPTEARSVVGARNRMTLATRYERMFEDAAGRVVKRETADIRRAIKKKLGERDNTDFLVWLEDYYQKAPEWIRSTMMPVCTSYAEMVQSASQDEVGADTVDGVDEFTGKYVDGFAARHTGSSEGQIKKIVRETPGDPTEAVAQRLDEWDDRRAGKVAMNETVQLGNAIARFVFAAAGITRLRWNNTGSKTCEFCESLDGKIVGIEASFLDGGQSMEGVTGSGQRLTVSGPKFHPPIHLGCQCFITPER